MMESFTEEELKLIQECIDYANQDPIIPLPDHWLRMLVVKMAGALERPKEEEES